MRRFITLVETMLREDIEGQMVLGPVKYDQAHGIGQVPFNQNVRYMGMAVEMTPNQFLMLALHRDFGRSSNVEGIMKAIEEDKPIGSPFLQVILPGDADNEFAMVKGHEGRTRMEAIRRLYGNIPVLVHIFPVGGSRARHISDEQIASMRQKMCPERMMTPTPGPWFGKAFHLGAEK